MQLARELYAAEHVTVIPPDVAVKAWGHTGLTGPSRRKLAALKYYGLVEEVDGGVRVSKLAEAILHPADDEERARLLKKAALNPDIFREILQKFSRASDTSITSHLVRERDFNSKGADKFVEVFRETIQFANLDTESGIDDEITHGEGDEQTDDHAGGGGSSGREPGRAPRGQRNVAEGNVVDVFNLGTAQVAFERPMVLTQDEYDDLKSWVELVLRRAARSIQKAAADESIDESQNEEGGA